MLRFVRNELNKSKGVQDKFFYNNKRGHIYDD
jgi:hypothetical protein